ncbi:Brix domain-containing protein [Entophlyctis helioformis]|nr:Brix domain-containing protein [Entophlyctis helioformis]
MDGDDQDGEEDEEDEDVDASLAALAAASKKSSSDRVPRNKQRVLLVASRGITHRYRHLMNDFHVLLPHSKKDSKLDSKSHLEDLNELAELSNCNNCLYFEVRRHQDTFLWMSRTPNGPSVKFMVRNIHTMDELKMTGNCLKGSRPILSFDSVFSTEPHLLLLQEMFTQTFGVPKTSRKIKPFIDHVMSFSVVDNKIWIRNFQIIEKNPEKGAKSKDKPITLVEIGPRCVLDVIRIFDGSFGGSTLFENPHYISPNDVRRTIKAKINEQHRARLQSQVQRDQKKILNQMAPDPLADVFA